MTGLALPILDVNITLHGFRHTVPDDVAALLVGPEGQTALLMSDTGGASAVRNPIDITFDDEAAGFLPDNSLISAGAYRPTDGTDRVLDGQAFSGVFPAPAPAGLYSLSLSVFDGLSANGLWSLYLFDDTSGDSGALAGGWSLTFETTPSAVVPLPPALGLLAAAVAALGFAGRRRRGVA